MRPCMAATDARGRTPVQSPAAYTPRTEVRETRSTTIWPLSLVVIPTAVYYKELADYFAASKACEPLTTRPSSRVTSTPVASPPASRTTTVDCMRDRESTLIPR